MSRWRRGTSQQRRRLRAKTARLSVAVAALICVLSLALTGCGQTTSQWSKSVEVSAVIKGSSRNARFADGRCITVDVTRGGAVRFVVTVGKVYGTGDWTSGPPRFFYELLAEEDPDAPAQPPAQVKLDARVTSKSVNETDDVKTYDLRPAAALSPGRYNFV